MNKFQIYNLILIGFIASITFLSHIMQKLYSWDEGRNVDLNLEDSMLYYRPGLTTPTLRRGRMWVKIKKISLIVNFFIFYISYIKHF